MFTPHSIALEHLVHRLEKNPRTYKVLKEAAVTWPGSPDTACKPDALVMSPDPNDKNSTYLTYWEVDTSEKDVPKMSKAYRQADRWFDVVGRYNQHRPVGSLRPKFVYINSHHQFIRRITPDQLPPHYKTSTQK